MPDVRPDPKPVTEGGIGRKKPDRGNRRRGRITASRDGWLQLRQAKLGECRVCETLTLVRGEAINIELHHLVPRSIGGDDVEDNLVPLCPVCHGSVTRRNKTALGTLAESLDDAEYAYVVGKLGEGAMGRLFGVNQ